jgi:hypothetical protein
MRWLKPSALGLILFLPCVALTQFLPMFFPSFWAVMVLPIADFGETAATVALVGFDLLVASVVAMLLGRALTVTTRPARRDVLLAVGATVAVALLAAVIVSKAYWGYHFRRPLLDERVMRARQVHAVSPVGTGPAAGATEFVLRPDFSLDEAVQYGREHPYEAPHYRILVALADRRLLPAAPPASEPATLVSAYASLEATGLLVSGEPRYPGATRLFGTLIELEDETGSRLTFVGVSSAQVSNDHHAYYELVLAGSPPRVLSATRFFYDIAGMEGAEWWVLWLVFGVLGNAITVPATVIAVRALGRR